MAAKRLWYKAAIMCAALLAAVAVLPASGNDDSDAAREAQANALTDFLILAIKPQADERDYELVDVGNGKVDPEVLGAIAKALPRGFLGIGRRDADEAAEQAQCHAACSANTRCRDFAYVPPSDNQPVGMCHLKALADIAVGVMSPVTGRSERPEPETETVPETPAPVVGSEEPRATTPPKSEAPPRAPREPIPPPPELPALVAEYFPMPPRASPTAPPRDITVPPPQINPPPPIPVRLDPSSTAFAPPPPDDIAEPQPAVRKRGLPLWVALGAMAFMLAGATLYWRNHRVRTRARLTTRLVSNGIDGRTITLDGPANTDTSLRFVIRRNAPATHIEVHPNGALA